MNRTSPFWMICRKPAGPNSKTEPRKRYDLKTDAVEAAQKVADQVGKPMQILGVVDEVFPRDKNQGLLL